MVPYTFLQNLVNFGTQMGEKTLCTLTHQAANFTGGVTTSRFKLESLRNETAIEKKWKKKIFKHRMMRCILPKFSKLWPTLTFT